MFTGWFWSGTGISIAATNSTPAGWGTTPWSKTGFIGQFLGKRNDDAKRKIFTGSIYLISNTETISECKKPSKTMAEGCWLALPASYN